MMKPARNVALAIFSATVITQAAQIAGDGCNPTKGSCPDIPALNEEFRFDFKTSSKPAYPEWGLADNTLQYMHVTPNQPLEMRMTGATVAPNIWTSRYMHYGVASVDISAAPGKGVITSAVLLSDTDDEIDWEWSGNNFGHNSPKVQTNYFGKGITGNWDRGTLEGFKFDMTRTVLTYEIDWSPERLIWKINGKTVRTLRRGDTNNSDKQYPQTPARFHIGMWDAGGAPGVSAGTVQWAGGKTDLNGFPYSAYVRSVRITPYKSGCKGYRYKDRSGSERSIQCLKNDVEIKDPNEIPPVPTKPCSTPVPAPTQRLTPDGCAAYHKVKSGEKCDTIAKKYELSTEQLMDINPQVGEKCYGLWVNYWVCVSRPNQCDFGKGSSGSSTTPKPASSPSQKAPTSTSRSTDSKASGTSTNSKSSDTSTDSKLSKTSSGAANAKSSPFTSVSYPSAVKCPRDAGQKYTTGNGAVFEVYCGQYRAGIPLGIVKANSFTGCIESCAALEGCVDTSWVIGEVCLLKSTNGPVIDKFIFAGSKEISPPTKKPQAEAPVCDSKEDDGRIFTASNGVKYKIECNIDYPGNEIGVFDVPEDGQEKFCAEACARTEGCVQAEIERTRQACLLRNKTEFSVRNARMVSFKFDF